VTFDLCVDFIAVSGSWFVKGSVQLVFDGLRNQHLFD